MTSSNPFGLDPSNEGDRRLGTYLDAAKRQYDSIKGDLIGFTQVQIGNVGEAAQAIDLPGFNAPQFDQSLDRVNDFEEFQGVKEAQRRSAASDPWYGIPRLNTPMVDMGNTLT